MTHPDKCRSLGPLGRGPGDPDDLEVVHLHGGGDEVLLVQVRVVHWPGEGEVVRGVECVAGVQVEHHVIARLLSQLRELGLEPVHRVLIGDVEQGGDRNVLYLILFILIL